MSLLILPSRFTTQPQYPAKINPAYASRVGSILLPSLGGSAALNGQPLTVSGSGYGIVPTPLGIGYTHNADNTVRASLPGSTLGTAAGGSLLCVFRTTSSAVDGRLAAYGTEQGSGGNSVFSIGHNTSSLRVTIGGSLLNDANEYMQSINDGKVHCAVISASLFSNSLGYNYVVTLDGKILANTSSATSLGTSSTFSSVLSGGFRRGGLDIPSGEGKVLLVVPFCYGMLTLKEAIDLSANPRQIFKAPPRLFFAASGGSSAALAGNAQAIASASGALSVAVPIAGAAVGVATATGSLSTAMKLSGAAAAIAVASGNLTLGLSLSGQAIANAVASGTLGTQFQLAGNAQATALASGNLGTGASLAGAAQMAVSATGNLQVQVTLSGSAIANAAATGNLTASGSTALAGNAQAQASASGILSTSLPLAGNAQVAAAASGNLTKGVPLSGAAVAVVTALGNLTVTVSLSGAAVAQAIATGGLALSIPLAGAAIMHAVASGYLSVSGGTGPIVSISRSFAAPLEKRSFILEAEHRQTAAFLY